MNIQQRNARSQTKIIKISSKPVHQRRPFNYQMTNYSFEVNQKRYFKELKTKQDFHLKPLVTNLDMISINIPTTHLDSFLLLYLSSRCVKFVKIATNIKNKLAWSPSSTTALVTKWALNPEIKSNSGPPCNFLNHLSV